MDKEYVFELEGMRETVDSMFRDLIDAARTLADADDDSQDEKLVLLQDAEEYAGDAGIDLELLRHAYYADRSDKTKDAKRRMAIYKLGVAVAEAGAAAGAEPGDLDFDVLEITSSGEEHDVEDVYAADEDLRAFVDDVREALEAYYAAIKGL